ncbi:hypothetical protein [Kitasatospora sp. NPDC087315]|uniref:hypothetical protein n=1 Tax=Kitasatospora sp. NPDC087315 TaxID=3364069 RepID=UPI003805508C
MSEHFDGPDPLPDDSLDPVSSAAVRPELLVVLATGAIIAARMFLKTLVDIHATQTEAETRRFESMQETRREELRQRRAQPPREED